MSMHWRVSMTRVYISRWFIMLEQDYYCFVANCWRIYYYDELCLIKHLKEWKQQWSTLLPFIRSNNFDSHSWKKYVKHIFQGIVSFVFLNFLIQLNDLNVNYILWFAESIFIWIWCYIQLPSNSWNGHFPRYERKPNLRFTLILLFEWLSTLMPHKIEKYVLQTVIVHWKKIINIYESRHWTFSWRGQSSFKFHGNEIEFSVLLKLSASFDNSILFACTSYASFAGSILYGSAFLWNSIVFEDEYIFLLWSSLHFGSRWYIIIFVSGPGNLNILEGHSKTTMLLIFNNAAQGILSSFFFKYAG